MSQIKKTIYAALCVALGVVLPMAFHFIGLGQVFLPMHIPVLLCGLICGWPYGLACGAIAPALSSLITGMPPVAYLPSMTVELAVYGLVSGLLMRFVRTRSFIADIYISLAGAMLAGRIVSGLVNAFIFSAGSSSIDAWLTASFITAWPGIVIQIVIIPVLAAALEKGKLIAKRYTKTA